MAKLESRTIASTYQELVKRVDTYAQAGCRIELADASGESQLTGLYLEASGGGYVGIGKAVPTSRLEVYHDAHGEATPLVHIENATNTAANSNGLLVSGGDDVAGRYSFRAEQQNGTVSLFVAGDSKVGIGTATPDSELDIYQDNDGATAGPILTLTRHSDSVADADILGKILFRGRDDAGGYETYSYIQSTILDASNGTEDSYLEFGSQVAGTGATRMVVGYNGNVGIGTASPGSLLHIETVATTGAVPLDVLKLVVDDSSNVNLAIGEGPAIAFHVAEDGSFESYKSGMIAVVRENGTDGTSDAAMTFWTGVNDAAATEKMRITSTGSVGIGTDAPSGLLHLSSTEEEKPTLVIEKTGAANHDGGNLHFRIKEDSGFVDTGKEMGDIQWQSYDTTGGDTGYHTSAMIRTVTSGTHANNVFGGEMQFWTNPDAASTSQRMTILADGNVGIGEPSPEQKLHVKLTANCFIEIESAEDAGIMLSEDDNLKWTIFNDATNDRIYITDVEGDDGMYMTQGAADWTDASDERLKHNLSPIEDAVGKLNTLQAINFKWKYGSDARKARNNIGLLAQEVNAVIPEVVDAPSEDFYLVDHPTIEGEKKAEHAWGVSYAKIVPVLVKAIQELSAKVTALENA